MGIENHHLKIVLCVAAGVRELETHLLSAIATFPEADLVLITANGFQPEAGKALDLRRVASKYFRGEVLLYTMPQSVPPYQLVGVLWDILPHGAKDVAFCVKKCQVSFSLTSPARCSSNESNRASNKYVPCDWLDVGYTKPRI